VPQVTLKRSSILQTACESHVERHDVAFVAKAVGNALRITWIAEQLGNLFSNLRRAQDRAITFYDILADTDVLLQKALLSVLTP